MAQRSLLVRVELGVDGSGAGADIHGAFALGSGRRQVGRWWHRVRAAQEGVIKRDGIGLHALKALHQVKVLLDMARALYHVEALALITRRLEGAVVSI